MTRQPCHGEGDHSTRSGGMVCGRARTHSPKRLQLVIQAVQAIAQHGLGVGVEGPPHWAERPRVEPFHDGHVPHASLVRGDDE